MTYCCFFFGVGGKLFALWILFTKSSLPGLFKFNIQFLNIFNCPDWNYSLFQIYWIEYYIYIYIWVILGQVKKFGVVFILVLNSNLNLINYPLGLKKSCINFFLHVFGSHQKLKYGTEINL